MYRESAIKKQMEYLQKELDDMHPETLTDIQKFEKKIDEAGMNEDAEKEARKVLDRLKQEGKNSPETGMLYDYLDFVTGLSWKKQEAEYIDLSEAEKILNEDHYGLDKVKKRIIQQIAVMNLKKEQSGSILLFVGAPGTGKTSIGKSIAKSLGREYVRVSLGGIRDEADIRGIHPVAHLQITLHPGSVKGHGGVDLQTHLYVVVFRDGSGSFHDFRADGAEHADALEAETGSEL